MKKEQIAALVGGAIGFALPIILAVFVYLEAQEAVRDHQQFRANAQLAAEICYTLSPEPRPSRRECRRRAVEAADYRTP